VYFPNISVIHIGGASTNQIQWFQLKNKVIARFKFFYKHYPYYYYLFAIIIEYFGNLLRGIIYSIWGVLTFNTEKIELANYYMKALTLSRKSK
jgi:GT2 family glycosyltransferase